MTKEDLEKMQAFLAQKIAKGEFCEEQIYKLTDVLYPHDGTPQAMLAAVRQQESEFAAWQANPNPQPEKKDNHHEVKPMSDAEIDAIAAMF